MALQGVLPQGKNQMRQLRNPYEKEKKREKENVKIGWYCMGSQSLFAQIELQGGVGYSLPYSFFFKSLSNSF